jgi:hypothetical protein
MTKTMKLFSILALALFGTFAFGQSSIVQTTLSAAVNAPGSGNATGYDTTVSLTSATGITQAQNGAPVTYLYIDQEAMAVLTTIPGSTTIFNVLRGQMGTKATAHANGTMVLLGVISPQFGGFSGSGGFQVTDPGFNAACTPATTGQTPWVNVLTSAQWLCSSITNTWVPGFHNPFTSGGEENTAAVASATTLTPSGPLFHITGAVAVTTIGIPVGFNATAVGGGQFCVIPDNATVAGFTAGNNIAKSTTFVVNQVLCMTWDATNSKFVASY